MGWLDDIARTTEQFIAETVDDVERIIDRAVSGEDD